MSPDATGAFALRAPELTTLLCDADGNLFPSEEPAFEASTTVTNAFLADHGIDVRFTPDELRRAAVGRNFRATALALAEQHGVAVEPSELERYVGDERRAVVEHLRRQLRPDAEVLTPLTDLARRFRLAIVSSSALSRLDACFHATGLTELFPSGVRFSAEDSLPVATTKPDPAVYAHAGRALGVAGRAALAVEDAPVGVESARRAGFPVVGNLAFVPEEERRQRASELVEAGAVAIVGSWSELSEALGAATATSTAGEGGDGRRPAGPTG